MKITDHQAQYLAEYINEELDRGEEISKVTIKYAIEAYTSIHEN